MRPPALFALLIGCWLVTGCQHGPPLSKEQEQRYGEMLRSGKVKTEFDPGVSLSLDQQIAVLVLAELCGINDPVKMDTNIDPVSRELVMGVSSRERMDGRNRSFDRVWVFKRDWRNGSSISSGKRLGEFWCSDSGPSTFLLRRYEFRGRPVEFEILGNIQMDLADEIVSKIEQRKMRFEVEGRGFADKDYFERRLGRIGDGLSLSIGSKDGDYQVWMGDDRFVFYLDGPGIVITTMCIWSSSRSQRA